LLDWTNADAVGIPKGRRCVKISPAIPSRHYHPSPFCLFFFPNDRLGYRKDNVTIIVDSRLRSSYPDVGCFLSLPLFLSAAREGNQEREIINRGKLLSRDFSIADDADEICKNPSRKNRRDKRKAGTHGRRKKPQSD